MRTLTLLVAVLLAAGCGPSRGSTSSGTGATAAAAIGSTSRGSSSGTPSGTSSSGTHSSTSASASTATGSSGASTATGAGGTSAAASSGAIASASASSSSSGSSGICGTGEMLDGLVISAPLQLSASTVALGGTLTATATLCNPTSAAIALEHADIAGRPPGGMDFGGPYDDFLDGPAVTLAAGQSYTLTGSETFASPDPVGSGWYAFVTVENAAGTYLNSTNNVPFMVVSATASSSSSGSLSSTASSGSGSSGAAASSSSSSGSTGSTLAITTASLPGATVGVAYAASLAATGGTGTGYAFNLVSAAPNTGLWAYVTPSGVVGGTPEMVEEETAVLQVTDSAGNTAQATLTVAVSATGSLSIASVTTPPPVASGGLLAYQLIAEGGLPPYVWSSSITPQPCYLDWDGWLLCAPTSTGTLSIPVTVTDSSGATATQTESVTVGSDLTLAGIDSTDGLIHLPPASAGSAYVAHLGAWGGAGSGYSFSATAGLPTWATLSTAGVLSGTPSESGNVELALQVTDSAQNTATASALVNVSDNGWVARPAYNSSPANGFFMLGGQLYDPDGYPFRIRGIDRCHYDSTSWASGASGALSGANAVRFFQYNIGDTSSYYGATQFYGVASDQSDANGILPIITAANVANSSTGTSGDTSTADLSTVVAWWVENEPTWAPIMDEIAINIANEWGPGASTTWQYAYQAVQGNITGISGTTITLGSTASTNPFASTPFAYIAGANGVAAQVVTLSSPGGSAGSWTVQSSASLSGYAGGGVLYGGAVGALRAAGYTAPLVIDSGGSGQDQTDLLDYAASIQVSDPLQNCLFAFHAYGGVTNFAAAISNIASGSSTTTVTLNSNLPYHPFNPSYPANNNNYTGQSSYVLSGVQGLTNINGLQSTNHNNIGGTQGAWTVTLDGTFTGSYVAGTGTIVAESHYQYVLSQLAALRSQSVGVAVLEFGPGNQSGDPTTTGVGPSPTNVSVQQIITAAEAYQMPWAYWAWDDNNAGGGDTGFTGWFGATLHGPGEYALGAPSDLTATGMDVVLNPRYGLGTLASPAAYFE